MPRRFNEEDDSAPPPPCFSTPTKANGNDGAGHAEQDAEGTDNDSDADVEKEFDESTGKKRNYNPYLQCSRSSIAFLVSRDACRSETLRV